MNDCTCPECAGIRERAGELDRLKAENARLRAALAELIPLAAHPDYPEGDDPAVGRARRLLWEKKHG